MKQIHGSPQAGDTPRLEFRHLAMIASLAVTRSIANSASEMGVTPSAVSHRMTEAERRVGVRLFSRQAGRLHLTPAGEILLAAARSAMFDVAKAERDARKLGSGIEHTLRFAIAYYAAYYWFPAFLVEWRRHNPSVHLEVVGDSSRHTLESLLAGVVDLAILPYKPSTPDVAAKPILRDELILAVPPKHRMTRMPFASADDLSREEFFVYTKMVVPGHEYDRILSGATHLPRFLSVELPEVIANLISARLGVSILSRWAILPSLEAGLVAAVPVTRNGLPITWYAVVRADEKTKSPAVLMQQLLARWWRKLRTS